MYEGFLSQDKDSFASQDRWNIDLAHEQWLEHPKGIEQKPVSFAFGLTRMFDFSLSRNNSFAFGLGMHWLNHYSNANFTSTPGINDLPSKDTLMAFSPTMSYHLNKYVLQFLDLNTEIRLRFGHERRVKFYAGFRGSWLISHHLKYRDDLVKYKNHHVPGFEKFNYGPTLRIGLDKISLYACYLLVPVYNNASKQQIKSFSAGITIFFL